MLRLGQAILHDTTYLSLGVELWHYLSLNTHAQVRLKLSPLTLKQATSRNRLFWSFTGADTGQLRGEGILHDCAQSACTNGNFRHMMMIDNDAKAKINGSLSEMIQIVAKSPNVPCNFSILWTKGKGGS